MQVNTIYIYLHWDYRKDKQVMSIDFVVVEPSFCGAKYICGWDPDNWCYNKALSSVLLKLFSYKELLMFLEFKFKRSLVKYKIK